MVICFQILDHDSLAFQIVLYHFPPMSVVFANVATASCTAVLSVLSVVGNRINKHLSTYCMSGTMLDSGDTEMN